MEKQTPGPWKLVSKGPGYYVQTEGGFNVAIMNASKPDARLIAAAPDLLAACKAMQNVLRSGSTGGKDLSYELELAQAAIAKAAG